MVVVDMRDSQLIIGRVASGAGSERVMMEHPGELCRYVGANPLCRDE